MKIKRQKMGPAVPESDEVFINASPTESGKVVTVQINLWMGPGAWKELGKDAEQLEEILEGYLNEL